MADGARLAKRPLAARRLGRGEDAVEHRAGGRRGRRGALRGGSLTSGSRAARRGGRPGRRGTPCGGAVDRRRRRRGSRRRHRGSGRRLGTAWRNGQVRGIDDDRRHDYVRARIGDDRRHGHVRAEIGAARRLGQVRAGIGDEAAAVRHLDPRQRAGVDPVVFADDVVEVEHVGDHRVDFVRRERAGLVERHGAVDVVPQGGGGRPEAAHRLPRLLAGQQPLSAGQGVVRPLAPGGPVTGGAPAVVQRPALGRSPAAGGQPLAGRADDRPPGIDFLGRRRTAQVGQPRPAGGRLRGGTGRLPGADDRLPGTGPSQ